MLRDSWVVDDLFLGRSLTVPRHEREDVLHVAHICNLENSVLTNLKAWKLLSFLFYVNLMTKGDSTPLCNLLWCKSPAVVIMPHFTAHRQHPTYLNRQDTPDARAVEMLLHHQTRYFRASRSRWVAPTTKHGVIEPLSPLRILLIPAYMHGTNTPPVIQGKNNLPHLMLRPVIHVICTAVWQ